MKITAYRTTPYPMELLPASHKRRWMDETSNQYAYRCLPLQIANASGWVMNSPSDFIISWNGGNLKSDLQCHIAKSDFNFAASSFGYGIVTFHSGYLFKTDDDINKWDLLVTGLPNYFYECMVPLTGIVENWWSPYTFTMNWKLNSPGTYSFNKGDPLMFIMPIPHVFPEIEAEVMNIIDDEKVLLEFKNWSEKRNKTIAALQYIEETGKPIGEYDPKVPSTLWEKDYMRGQHKDGTKENEHLTKRRMPEFKERK